MTSKIFSINIDIINSFKLNQAILKYCEKKQKIIISNVNINALNIAYSNKRMHAFLSNADINFIDGDGVNWGLRLTGQKAGPKITYDWWIWEFAKFSEENQLSWFVLGASQSVIAKAITKLKERHPNLQIVGYNNGYFNKNNDENKKVIQLINKAMPNILLTAMGMPIQEEWLLNNWEKVNANVALTGGAVLDYIAEELKSTPDMFRKFQLEWFYRFIQRPKYFWKRYLIGNPLFIYRVLKGKIFNRKN